MMKEISNIFRKSENDWLKVTVSIFFSIIMMIFFGKTVVSSYAISNVLPDTLTSGSSGQPADFIDLFPELTENETLRYQPFYATDGEGNKYVVYCLEKDKEWANNQTITKSPTPLDAGYTYIIQNGYNGTVNPNLTTGSAKNDEYLTKIAIWWYQDRSNGVDDNATGVLTANQKNVIKNGNSKYYNYINTLVEGALNAKDTLDVEPSFNILDNTNSTGCNYRFFTYDKENHIFKSNLYHIESNISFDNYQIIIDNNPNVKVYLEDGTLVNSTDTINSNSKFYLQIDEKDASNTQNVSFSLNINYTKYNVYRYTPENAEAQSGVVAVPEAVTMNKVVETSLLMPTRNLKINKKDNNDNYLTGAHLIVYNYHTGEKVADFTTDGSEYIIENLVPGTYVVDEVESPKGYYPLVLDDLKALKLPDGTTLKNVVAKYELDDLSKFDNLFQQGSGCIENIDNVTISDAMQALQNAKNNNIIDIVNSKYIVRIAKVTYDKAGFLSGAILNIVNSNNEVVDTITTTNGYTFLDTSKMSEGTYKVVEVKAPDGYFVNTEAREFTLDKNNTNFAVTFYDEINEVLIEKRDASDNKFVSGARLRLVRVSDNQVIDEWTSNDSAHSVKELVKGEYKVIEVEAPNGYTLSNSEVPFTITGEEKEAKRVTFYNSKNQVVINKVDENGEPLSGARLRITNSNGDEIKTFTTTKEAYTLDKLSPGTYYVEEIEAPSGYQVNKEKESFTINENTTSIQVTMENIKTRMYLAKVDEYGECIPGATLRLLDSNKEEIETFVSSDMPYFIEGLDYGIYYLEEVTAPSGYIKNNEQVKINYTADNVYGTFSITNKTGRLTIEKIDNETKEVISGVTLEIRKGDKVVKTITTTNSPTVITDLGEGTYNIIEINTPLSYIKSDKEYVVTIDSKTPNATVTIENKPIIVNLGKIDASTKEYIAGATMKLERLDGVMEPITFVSSNSPYQVRNLVPGLYSLEEVEAPSGYVGTGSKVTFRVLETGKVQTVNISNDITTISVNNKILTVDTKGIEGYTFRLETRDGKVIDEFTTTKDAYISDSLEIGEYTLKQIEAPEGVIVNESPIYFSVSDVNEVNVVNFVNDFTKVSISKKDMVGSEEVEGAHLVIKDSNGSVVEEWISSNTPHYIEKLPVGKYTLTETIAPEGYILNSSVVEFNVLETGDIQSEVMFNSKPIEVPNTGINAIYTYLIGGVLIIIGTSIIYISYKNKIKNLSR